MTKQINEATQTRCVFIGNAWPYANGSLHLGHAACLLPGDVIARYFRAAGDRVCFVSGSDCHGTPITLKAEAEGVGPGEIARRYHEEFLECYARLGISYDAYIPTTDMHHQMEVRAAFNALLAGGWLVPRTSQQTYCPSCARFLPDRYVDGVCPRCGDGSARGDQCDSCGVLLTPDELSHPRCRLCGTTPESRPTEHLFFRLSALQDELEAYVTAFGGTDKDDVGGSSGVCNRSGIGSSDNLPGSDSPPGSSRPSGSDRPPGSSRSPGSDRPPSLGGWRANALGMTQRYLSEGLIDRAATRDIEWGIPVPVERDGYEGKRVYVWFEAVLGYLTASKLVDGWEDFWSGEALTYYAHGKDNIPFHTIIWPGMLMTLGGLALPRHIVSSEYLTLEGRKISTSRNWAVWLPDFLARYNPDSLRYFLIAAGPESRDADFSWREFVERNNSELLGAYGNFVHRTLAFVSRYMEGLIPEPGEFADAEALLLASGEAKFQEVGRLIEEARLKEALRSVFDYVRECNRYFDSTQPWITRESDPSACRTSIYACIQSIGILCQLLEPFLPFSAGRIRSVLNKSDSGWKPLCVDAGTRLGDVQPLFQRLDKSVVEEELERLKGRRA